MLKGVLFDLDDTLLDWSGFAEDWTLLDQEHVRGVFEYISAEVHPLSDVKAYCSEFHDRMRAAWEAARGNMRAPHVGTVLVETAAAFGVPAESVDMQRCLEAYRWSAVPGTAIFPDVPEALALLRQCGIETGIVTNAYQPMWMRDIEIEHYGLSEYFPACRVSAADIGYLKPHPAIFQEALERLGTRPEETVFVGDDLSADIAGAQAVGMRAIWRPVVRRSSSTGDTIVPDATITTLAQLPAILDRWYPGWRNEGGIT